jgi:class 3 adenylate cyclase
MTAATACRTCGRELREDARFCDACGAPSAVAHRAAEYKQVTVLFADVVRSMDIAAAVGAERLREMMTELVNRCAAVVQRYGGTVDKFTGDGIMAVFGAPAALEDHAFRACLAALDIQKEAERLAAEIQRRDGVAFRLRVGLNSGQVIAGEIGSGPVGYTAIGEQVGVAQRMESVAPAGGVMLSESTARLVEDSAVLGAPELLHIKGAVEPVCARQLVAISPQRGHGGPHTSPLVGREWELAALTAMLDRSMKGHGCVARVVGPAGMGKSRVVAEMAAAAARRGVSVFSTFCESHASGVPFHASNRLLRAALGIEGLDDDAARVRLRSEVPGADPADLLLLDDALGIADPAVEVPDVAADARRRRLTALVNATALARSTPGVYVIEDAHWIDKTSESLLADFMAVVPQTHSLVVITYRPDYGGALTRVAGGQTIALAPLEDSETATLIAALLGADATVVDLIPRITERAAGNPFFAEEIVRDLADRGVLSGARGGYVCAREATDVTVPATLQAAIAARIDRLAAPAKRTLGAAAAIGLRFGEDLLGELVDTPVLTELTELAGAELIDQVMFTPRSEFAFLHPLIRAVAYESQLKAERAGLHRRVATAVAARDPAVADENAALIAEHLQAAGDLHAAYGWQMRAGAWSLTRDLAAALRSWERASQLADAVTADDPGHLSMRIAPRCLLCANAFRVHRGDSNARFGELEQLCTEAGDKASLAIGMTGLLADLLNEGRLREASRLATEHMALLESVGDAALIAGLAWAAILVKNKSAEAADALRWSQAVIDLAADDPTRGKLIMGSPLAAALGERGIARMWLGLPGWREDLDLAVALGRDADALSHATAIVHKYIGIASGVLIADDMALAEIDEALQGAERSGDDFALALTRETMGLALAHRDGTDEDAIDLLTQARDMAVQGAYSLAEVPLLNVYIARTSARRGDRDGALAAMREAVDELFDSGHYGYLLSATNVLVETLLEQPGDDAAREAAVHIDRLAAAPIDHGSAARQITLLRLRTLLARARGEQAAYQESADRYRAMARTLGFQGHIAWAQAMA